MVEIRHKPVLLQETVDGLCVQSGDIVLDGTLGSGGHSLEILRRVLPDGKVIAIDTDNQAIERFVQRAEAIPWAKQALSDGRMQLFHNNFGNMATVLDEAGEATVSGIVVDLGFSSDQMDAPTRGMSFSKEGPLDMRLDRENTVTAEHIIHEYSEERLTEIVQKYGEERFAKQIARAIVRARAKKRIRTTTALASIIEDAIPKRYQGKKIHPATKTFQALRIEVNRELDSLEKFLPQAVERLKKGGRIAVISFHSGEDRIVKRFFQENARGCICPKEFPICQCGKLPRVKKITAKAMVPSDAEIKENPRSRSARLRIAERV